MFWSASRSRARLLAITLLVALTGCAQQPSTPEGLAVADIVTGRILASDGTIVDEARTNLFWTTDVFYVSVTLEGSAEQVTLQARWTGPDGKLAADASKTISPQGTTVTSFAAPLPSDGRWPAGDYTVEILLNGRSQGTRDLNAR